jgi:pimeloyl-ACP methyl ester carboxylesterase
VSALDKLFEPWSMVATPQVAVDAIENVRKHVSGATDELQASTRTADILATAVQRHGDRISASHSTRSQAAASQAQKLVQDLQQRQASGQLSADWQEYLRDATERLVLSLNTLRQRGDVFLEHEASGCPPVLIYDYEVVMDGKDLPYPSNYVLLRIVPPAGTQIIEQKRPYIVIDPRAGHGPGIGGFKTDSQVGVALRHGHPVYFVAFRREPEPGQFLAYVTRAEAAFVREVMRRHPQSAKPVVIGNCQGGWATLLLAATNPDLTGPVVINGAPVAPWSGRVGENPMRYNAGVLGGTWIPMFLSDLGGGVFDGAHLVQNFELMNPARTLFRKYTDLFRDVDTAEETFLNFERWWGGFFLLSEPEIRWIVEQLFVGNRLVKNEARIEPGRPVDLKAIRAPIIVFASHGDNITPPQQALNWIAATYADVAEIRIRGQRIVYMVHDQVGHLGIFVSSQVANKEHAEMASTLKTIEALAPGLYEMKIEEVADGTNGKRFRVGFVERTLDDVRALDDVYEDERPFAAVARASEVQAQIYDTLVRPLVKASVTSGFAQATRDLHPQRWSRAVMSSHNPAMRWVESGAEQIRRQRTKASPSNPFLAAEALWVNQTEQAIDWWKDCRDMGYEMAFHGFWGQAWGRSFGRTHEAGRTLKSLDELRSLPEVTHALHGMDRGGLAEAVIRMMVLLVESRGQVRRDRLERASAMLTQDEPFRSLGAERRTLIIHQQTLIATYERERAIQTLPSLLPDEAERGQALATVRYVAGGASEMSPHTVDMLRQFGEVLGIELGGEDVLEDPLQAAPAPAKLRAAARATGSTSRRAPTNAKTKAQASVSVSVAPTKSRARAKPARPTRKAA